MPNLSELSHTQLSLIKYISEEAMGSNDNKGEEYKYEEVDRKTGLEDETDALPLTSSVREGSIASLTGRLS